MAKGHANAKDECHPSFPKAPAKLHTKVSTSGDSNAKRLTVETFDAEESETLERRDVETFHGDLLDVGTFHFVPFGRWKSLASKRFEVAQRRNVFVFQHKCM